MSAVGAGIAISIVIIVASNVSFLLSTRNANVAAASRSLENLSISIERSIAAEIAERKEDLAGLAPLLAQPDPGLPDTVARAIGPYLRLDAEGHAAASSSPSFPPGDYGQEAFFKALRSAGTPGTLVAPGPVAQAPSVALVLARRLPSEGPFEGAVANAITFDRIAGLLSQFDLGDGGVISILTQDGRLLTSDRRQSPTGLDLSTSQAFRHVMQRGLGPFEAVSQVDGRRRFYVSRRIAETSLILFVGTALETVYAPFRAVAAVEITAVAVLAVLIAGFAAAARRELRRRRASERAAEQAALAARQNEALVTTYFENLAHAVLAIRVQPSGQLAIERVNANAHRLLGISGDVLGRDPRDVFHDGRLPDLVPMLLQSLQTRRPSQRTIPFKTERSLSLRLTVTPVQGEADGSVALLLASLEDVTFHEIAQARLLETHRSTGIERITGGVANEFNNLLQSMIGHLEMLSEEVADNIAAASHARSALDAAARGTRLTQGLLSSSSQQLLQPEPVVPERKLARLLRAFEPKKDPRIRLVTTVEPNTPAVQADSSHLMSALLNLCENAQEAMLPAGGTVSIRVYSKQALSPAGGGTALFVVFAVTDEGDGMTPDVLARAREPFFTTKGERFRSGLGLSMADGFARQTGGELSIESSPGRGTTVALMLPAAEQEPPETDHGPLSHPVRILVVDDSADQLAMLEELLADEGCLVTALGNPADAASVLRSDEPFDLLITDYVMPGTNGMELIADAFRLRPGIMALLITGTPDAPQPPASHGSLSLLRKPFRADQLLRRVRQMARSADQTTLIG